MVQRLQQAYRYCSQRSYRIVLMPGILDMRGQTAVLEEALSQRQLFACPHALTPLERISTRLLSLYPETGPLLVMLQVGDVIMEVSAVTLKAGKVGEYESEGYGQRPFDNFEKSMMSCAGQSFDVVMSAIASNNPRWGYNTVDLVILRPDCEI